MPSGANVKRMMADNSLSDAARVIGFALAAMGDAWHEVPRDEFAKIAHGFPSGETIAKHLRQLELREYIERKAGGRGHPDNFRFVFRSVENPVPKTETETLDGSDSSGKNTAPKDSSGKNTAPIALSSGEFTAAKTTVVVDREIGSSRTPVVPLDDLTTRALETHDQLLTGLRGSLRDYLAARVPEKCRYGYVQTVAGWLNGMDGSVFRVSDGGRLQADEQRKLLANALNDLMATDEATMKRPVGDPGNLRTKLNVLLKMRTDNGGHANAGSTGRKGQREASEFKPTGTDGRRSGFVIES